MSEMDLGGKIALTVPQLRTYLDCMKRLAEAEEVVELSGYGSSEKAVGIRKATSELLKCLNLPENWAEQMDSKEQREVEAGLTSEEKREEILKKRRRIEDQMGYNSLKDSRVWLKTGLHDLVLLRENDRLKEELDKLPSVRKYKIGIVG